MQKGRLFSHMIASVYKFNIIHAASLVREIRHVHEGNRFHACYSVINNFTHLKHTIPHFIVIYNINDVYISE